MHATDAAVVVRARLMGRKESGVVRLSGDGGLQGDPSVAVPVRLSTADSAATRS